MVAVQWSNLSSASVLMSNKDSVTCALIRTVSPVPYFKSPLESIIHGDFIKIDPH